VRNSRHQAIRDLLLAAEDGLTTKQLAEKLNSNVTSTNLTLRNVWGVYIDRWTKPRRGQHAAVYMCVEVPENVPRPRSAK
jgi:hypothetical protein